MNQESANSKPKIEPNILEDSYLDSKILKIKEQSLSKISPIIIIKPAIFSFIILLGSFFIDLSSVPFLGRVTNIIAENLYPQWQPITANIEPIQFWWLPLFSYFLFIGIAIKEYKGLFSHVRTTTPRENIDRIISSSISLIDGYATALPLIGAAFLLVSIKLGPEIFLGLAVPFEIKALVVLAIAKLFEPVLDYIGVKFQKVINTATDYQEKYYKQLELQQMNKLVGLLTNREIEPMKIDDNQFDLIQNFREELERIHKISFETNQNFIALNKLSEQLNEKLKNNDDHLTLINDLSRSIDSMASNLSNESVSKSLNSLEQIIIRR